jgi:hypothetical protein
VNRIRAGAALQTIRRLKELIVTERRAFRSLTAYRTSNTRPSCDVAGLTAPKTDLLAEQGDASAVPVTCGHYSGAKAAEGDASTLLSAYAHHGEIDAGGPVRLRHEA